MSKILACPLLQHLPQLKIIIAIGHYAQLYYIKEGRKKNLSENVRHWREIFSICQPQGFRVLPLPHPSWRNNHWLKKNPWFTQEALPEIKKFIAKTL